MGIFHAHFPAMVESNCFARASEALPSLLAVFKAWLPPTSKILSRGKYQSTKQGVINSVSEKGPVFRRNKRNLTTSDKRIQLKVDQGVKEGRFSKEDIPKLVITWMGNADQSHMRRPITHQIVIVKKQKTAVLLEDARGTGPLKAFW